MTRAQMELCKVNVAQLLTGLLTRLLTETSPRVTLQALCLTSS